MAKKIDGFHVEPEKLLSSVDLSTMSIEEFGAYWKILFSSWIQPRPCYISKDDAILAKLCKVSPERWEQMKQNVLKKYKVEGDFMYSEKLLLIWKSEQKQKFSKKKSQLSLLTSLLNYTFDQFWNDYDKKVGSCERIIPKWLKLTNEDREAVRVHIRAYKLQQPDKHWRMKPERYLNERAWEQQDLFRKPKGVLDYKSEERKAI